MKILFTGSSSFTGYWFIRHLAAAGHKVTAIFTNDLDAYTEVRGLRVTQLTEFCEPVTQCTFGDEAFLRLLENEDHWDVFCHHAADVTNYKSEDFNVISALDNNTRNLPLVLSRLREKGCSKVVLTGSVFEPYEGAGGDNLRAFSPYGLSKGLTAEVFRYQAGRHGFHLGKFVIPNPFGPYEDPRFTSYLLRTWTQKDVAQIKTPAYVRDNIHVELLARAYVNFIESLPDRDSGFSRINPSGYAETQGSFTLRFANAIGERLGLECKVQLMEQQTFEEPGVRINTDIPDFETLNFSESSAWDDLAEYYRRTYL